MTQDPTRIELYVVCSEIVVNNDGVPQKRRRKSILILLIVVIRLELSLRTRMIFARTAGVSVYHPTICRMNQGRKQVEPN